MKVLGHLLWGTIAVAAAFCLGGVALYRGEHINSIWLVLAASCTYLTAYRFYGRFVAARVMALDDRRATPAERLRNGHDFEPTNKWILLGHHFAAIAGPGPLMGPVLAAQFGYLPGTLWIIIGAVAGGAVQDFVILFASMRRDGKSVRALAIRILFRCWKDHKLYDEHLYLTPLRRRGALLGPGLASVTSPAWTNVAGFSKLSGKKP